MSKLDEIIRTIREDAYGDGENSAGHPFSIDKDKDMIKDLIQNMLDEAFPAGDKQIYRFWKTIERL